MMHWLRRSKLSVKSLEVFPLMIPPFSHRTYTPLLPLQRMTVAWPQRRRGTVRTSSTASYQRWRENGPPSSLPSWGRISDQSTESSSSNRWLVKWDHPAYYQLLTRKERWGELTVWGRRIKCGGWIWSWPSCSTPSPSSQLTERDLWRHMTVTTQGSAYSRLTSKSQSRS